MNKQKWGGFRRDFTKMGDRDPHPSIPFVCHEPFPAPPAWVSIAIVGLVLLAYVLLLGTTP